MTRGGKRDGAGRKPAGTTYSEGYQAGYKTGKRSDEQCSATAVTGEGQCDLPVVEQVAGEWYCSHHVGWAKEWVNTEAHQTYAEAERQYWSRFQDFFGAKR